MLSAAFSVISLRMAKRFPMVATDPYRETRQVPNAEDVLRVSDPEGTVTHLKAPAHPDFKLLASLCLVAAGRASLSFSNNTPTSPACVGDTTVAQNSPSGLPDAVPFLCHHERGLSRKSADQVRKPVVSRQSAGPLPVCGLRSSTESVT